MEVKKNKKNHVKSGDIVLVITGNSKGKSGKILSIVTDKNAAIVEGLNIVKRHMKPSASSPNGGIIEKEAPIHLSNLKLVDPKTGLPTKVGRKLDANGDLKRYSKKTQQFI
jgi:large subunit ribosomal protein L24